MLRSSLARVVLPALLAPAVSAQLPQQHPFDHPDGTTHWYSAVGVPGGITWDGAHALAAAAGGYLATLTSDDENAFVFGLVDSPGYWTPVQHPAGNTFLAGPWCGAVRMQPPPVGANPEGWRWTELEIFGYGAFAPGWSDPAAGRLGFGAAGAAPAPTWIGGSPAERRTGFVIEFDGPTSPITTGLVLPDSEQSEVADGYTLFAPIAVNRNIYLVDGRGRVVHEWNTNRENSTGIYLLETGELLRSALADTSSFVRGGANGVAQKLDWSGNILWEFELSTQTEILHHDLEPMPNGNVLAIVWVRKTAAEALAMGRDPGFLADNEVWSDSIIEIDPAGQIVWRWNAWDHLLQNFDPTKPNYEQPANNPHRIDLNYGRYDVADWLHTNSVDYDPVEDQIILSPREFSELWVIDHSTTTAQAATSQGGRSGRGGDLLYRWGNPEAFGSGGPQDRVLFGAHDPHRIPPGMPGAGNILVFNNGDSSLGIDESEVLELLPPQQGVLGNYTRMGPGLPWGPSTPLQRIAPAGDHFFALFTSGSQRLPGGNTLVMGGSNSRFLEIDTGGDTVWEYRNPSGPSDQRERQGDVHVDGDNIVFRAPWYPPDYPGLAGRALTPGEPLETYTTRLLVDGSPVDRRVGPDADVVFDLISENEPGAFYVVGTSLRGGLTPIDLRYARSAVDDLFLFSIQAGASTPFFDGTVGFLDSDGRASSTLHLPGWPVLVGNTFHTTFFTVYPDGIGTISNTVRTHVID